MVWEFFKNPPVYRCVGGIAVELGESVLLLHVGQDIDIAKNIEVGIGT